MSTLPLYSVNSPALCQSELKNNLAINDYKQASGQTLNSWTALFNHGLHTPNAARDVDNPTRMS